MNCQINFPMDRTIGYITAVAYGLMTCIAVAACVRFFLIERRRHYSSNAATVGKLFHCFLPAPLFMRSLGFFLDPSVCSSFADQRWFSILLQAVPGYVFLFCFGLLVLFWAFLVEISRHFVQPSLLQRLYLGCALVISIVTTLILTPTVVLPTKSPLQMLFHTMEATYAMALDLCVSVGFAVFGGKLIAHLTRLGAAAEAATRPVGGQSAGGVAWFDGAGKMYMGDTTSTSLLAATDDPDALATSAAGKSRPPSCPPVGRDQSTTAADAEAQELAVGSTWKHKGRALWAAFAKRGQEPASVPASVYGAVFEIPRRALRRVTIQAVACMGLFSLRWLLLLLLTWVWFETSDWVKVVVCQLLYFYLTELLLSAIMLVVLAKPSQRTPVPPPSR